jgi:glutamine amidotransferase
MITIVDYDRGNLFSLGQAVRYVGGQFEITGNPDRVAGADKIILPGVGAFGDGMARIRAKGLLEAIRSANNRGRPILGICLGMQMLADTSEEFGEQEGIGLIPGKVQRLPTEVKDAPGSYRIPNVGWWALNPTARAKDEFASCKMMYFLHSYVVTPKNDDDITATINFNGQNVAVAIRSGSIVGYQFHPEKSGGSGLSLIRSFVEDRFG